MSKAPGLFAPDGSMYFTLSDGQGNLYSNAYNWFTFDHIGDSRTSQGWTSGGYALASNMWFNQAAALAGQRYLWGLNQGISGDRSDQYLAQSNLSPCLQSNSGWLVFGMPFVNDIAQASNTAYTNANGASVTLSNVAAIGVSNIIAAATQALNLGKKVILTMETGSTSFTQAQIGALHEANQRLWAYAQATPNVYIWNPCPVVWNNTSSSTAIAFKTGYSSDGTHYTTLGAYNGGIAFNTFFQNLVPPIDMAISNINDVNATNARQLVNNPLFTTLTGGTATTLSVTGNVPSGWTISGAASTTCTITSASDANGYGNDITLAITTTGADTVTFQSNAPSNTLWTLNDIFQGGADVSVASGSSNAYIYFTVEANTDKGDNQQFALYNSGLGNGPTTAYSYRFLTLPRGVLAGSSTQSFLIGPRFRIPFTAAGNMTVTISRPYCNRTFTYNTTSGLFTG